MNKIAAGYLATEKRILEGYNDAKKKFDLGQPTAPSPKETDLRESQKKEIRQKLRTINFEVKWPKPVWQALGVDPHREAERISASVRCVVANLEAPPASALEITDAALGTSALPVLQRPADPQPQ